MEVTKSTFEKIMGNAPFLKGLIQDKITEEVGKKDVEINALKEELNLAKEELELVKDRATDTENAINMMMFS
jgi:hypothetical protein